MAPPPTAAAPAAPARTSHDARRVAETLGIPHYVLNYEERFRKAVIDPFAESYVAGETPIPCVSCNQTVKFADLLATARELGADGAGHRPLHPLAAPTARTGRFTARSTPTATRAISCSRPRRTRSTTCASRSAACPSTRSASAAEEMGLSVADKADSQDICFVPQGKYSDIIAKLRPEAATPGDIVHIDGRVLGRHDGILHYTVGQRRGIGVSRQASRSMWCISTPSVRG